MRPPPGGNILLYRVPSFSRNMLTFEVALIKGQMPCGEITVRSRQLVLRVDYDEPKTLPADITGLQRDGNRFLSVVGARSSAAEGDSLGRASNRPSDVALSTGPVLADRAESL
jgi:hypothetical protein